MLSFYNRSLFTLGEMPIALYTNANNLLMIAANENIGIGTPTDQDKKLHVQGSIKMTGACMNLYEPLNMQGPRQLTRKITIFVWLYLSILKALFILTFPILLKMQGEF